eukprot:3695700-Prymnesium_polylepis.1
MAAGGGQPARQGVLLDHVVADRPGGRARATRPRIARFDGQQCAGRLSEHRPEPRHIDVGSAGERRGRQRRARPRASARDSHRRVLLHPGDAAAAAARAAPPAPRPAR